MLANARRAGRRQVERRATLAAAACPTTAQPDLQAAEIQAADATGDQNQVGAPSSSLVPRRHSAPKTAQALAQPASATASKTPAQAAFDAQPSHTGVEGHTVAGPAPSAPLSTEATDVSHLKFGRGAGPHGTVATELSPDSDAGQLQSQLLSQLLRQLLRQSLHQVWRTNSLVAHQII